VAQLGLPFLATPPMGEFLPAASNAEARAWLDRPRSWPERRLLLWGEPGVGKSHLLARFAEEVGAPVHRVLPASLPPAALILDEADAQADEPGFLHLLNRAGEASLPVLLAARLPPARWSIRLADLASRMRAITAVEVEPPEDDLLRAMLARFLAERQLTVAPALQDYLLATLPRQGAALREAVARLDAGALDRGGRIDRTLIRDVL
jgi:chromosomal replication initiation ATPase DnaA